MGRKFVRTSILSIALMVLFSVILFSVLGLQLYFGNEHTSVPGELYRSAQPTRDDIKEYADKFGIKSIINLRGENLSEDWHKEEIAASKEFGIKHINYRMKAARELTNEQALELIEVMRKEPKPVLIHCKSGSDRTGLAAAFYIAAIKKGTEFDAEYQLSIRYGHLPHFPFWWTEAQAMHRTFERMEPLFGYFDS